MSTYRSAAAVGALMAATLIWGCSDTQLVEPDEPVASTRATILAPATPDTAPPVNEAAAAEPAREPVEIQTAFELPDRDEAEDQPPPDEATVRAFWQEGVALFESGDYASASAALQTAATGRPDEPYVHYLLGLARWKSGGLEQAEQMLERAAGLDDGAIRTWINLARVRLDRDDAAGALEAADAALAIDPDAVDAMHQRGRSLAILGQGEEAIEILTRARATDPENGYVANTLGYLMIQSDRPDEALPHLLAARDGLPGVAYVRNNLGVVFERLGETEKALAEYGAAVEAGDSAGKASASLARLEPAVERLIAGRGGVIASEMPPVARNAAGEDDSGGR